MTAKTRQQIAMEYGVCTKTLNKWLKDEGIEIPHGIRINLHNSLSDEQKNVLKREFLQHWMVQTLRFEKKSALLLEWVKFHFPDEMAEIEAFHDDEYQKQHEIIQAQIDKLLPENEELVEAA